MRYAAMSATGAVAAMLFAAPAAGQDSSVPPAGTRASAKVAAETLVTPTNSPQGE